MTSVDSKKKSSKLDFPPGVGSTQDLTPWLAPCEGNLTLAYVPTIPPMLPGIGGGWGNTLIGATANPINQEARILGFGAGPIIQEIIF